MIDKAKTSPGIQLGTAVSKILYIRSTPWVCVPGLFYWFREAGVPEALQDKFLDKFPGLPPEARPLIKAGKYQVEGDSVVITL